jgi:hypothetical protein
MNVRPSENRGRRECRVPAAPAAPCAIKSTGVGTTGQPDHSGIPCTVVLRLIPRSPRGPGSFAPVVPRINGADDPVGRMHLRENLAPASGRQDHTTSPSAAVSAKNVSTAWYQPAEVLTTTESAPFVCAPFHRSRENRPAITCAPTLPRPPHPAPTSVTFATRPSHGTGWMKVATGRGGMESEIFCRGRTGPPKSD